MKMFDKLTNLINTNKNRLSELRISVDEITLLELKFKEETE